MNDKSLLKTSALSLINELHDNNNSISKNQFALLKNLVEKKDIAKYKEDAHHKYYKISYDCNYNKGSHYVAFNYKDGSFVINDIITKKIKVRKNTQKSWEKLFTSLNSKYEEGQFELLKEGISTNKSISGTIEEFKIKLISLKSFINTQDLPIYFIEYVDSVLEKVNEFISVKTKNQSTTVKKIVKEEILTNYEFNILVYKLGTDKYLTEEKIYFENVSELPKNFSQYDLVIIPESEKEIANTIPEIVFFDGKTQNFENFIITGKGDLYNLINTLKKKKYDKIEIVQSEVMTQWYSSLIISKKFFTKTIQPFDTTQVIGNLTGENGYVWSLDMVIIKDKFKGITKKSYIDVEVFEKAPQIADSVYLMAIEIEEGDIEKVANHLKGINATAVESSNKALTNLKKYISNKINGNNNII